MRQKSGGSKTIEVPCNELLAAAQEYQVRNLCYWICVNIVANAVGRCEFRTFRGNTEIRKKDYYIWNVEPNINENSTMFLHKLVAKLYMDNEALIVNARPTKGRATMVVADSWTPSEEYPSRQREYSDVVVGDYQYRFPFREKQVIHLKLNHVNMVPVIDGMYRSYWRLVSAAMKNYEWNQGQHWKVHVAKTADGDKDFAQKFAGMIEEQVKPFLNSNGAILPEFEGYQYENVGGKDARDTRDIRNLVEDIFDFTARTFLIPAVLVNGKVEATGDANTRFLTECIDPFCDQLQEEINRKCFGYDRWHNGDYIQVDSSSIMHFDLFANAPNVEKLVGSGAFSINEVRRASNQSIITEPWADEHFMTKNIAGMEDVVRQLGIQKGEIEK